MENLPCSRKIKRLIAHTRKIQKDLYRLTRCKAHFTMKKVKVQIHKSYQYSVIKCQSRGIMKTYSRNKSCQRVLSKRSMMHQIQERHLTNQSNITGSSCYRLLAKSTRLQTALDPSTRPSRVSKTGSKDKHLRQSSAPTKSLILSPCEMRSRIDQGHQRSPMLCNTQRQQKRCCRNLKKWSGRTKSVLNTRCRHLSLSMHKILRTCNKRNSLKP